MLLDTTIRRATFVLREELENQFPKVKGAKPEDFTDSRLVRELDQSGFIKSLLAAR